MGTRTIAVEDGTLHSYVGGWAEFVRVREERADADREARSRSRARPSKAKAAPPPARPASSKNEQRQARRLEAEIERAEAELAAIEQELADPSAWNDPRSATRSTQRHAAAKARVEALYAELEAVAG